MEITPYQIAVPLASLVAILYAWSLVGRQKKTLWEALLWTVFWVGITTIALFPDSLKLLTRITGIKERENAVLVTGIGILFFIVFRLIVRMEELEQRQTKLVREVALKDGEEE